MSAIDLNAPPQGHQYKVMIDRVETHGERCVRLGKDATLFAVAVAFVVTIGVMCVTTLFSTTTAQDEKKWAMSVLSATTGALVGYLVRAR